jgi:hypothetical protein
MLKRNKSVKSVTCERKKQGQVWSDFLYSIHNSEETQQTDIQCDAIPQVSKEYNSLNDAAGEGRL